MRGISRSIGHLQPQTNQRTLQMPLSADMDEISDYDVVDLAEALEPLEIPSAVASDESVAESYPVTKIPSPWSGRMMPTRQSDSLIGLVDMGR